MIEDHVAALRRLIAQYPNLGDPKIYLDEFGMSEVQTIPGWDVAYLSALTDAGVNDAGRSCWGNACANPDLDSLIGTNGVSTPPTYYERLAYTSMSGNMITTVSTSDTVTSLGSYNPTTRKVTGLIGRGDGCTQDPYCAAAWPTATAQPPIDVNVSVTVPWITGTVVVALSDYEGQNTDTVTAPTPVDKTVLIVPTGKGTGLVTFSIPSFADGDAYGLVITPGIVVGG